MGSNPMLVSGADTKTVLVIGAGDGAKETFT